MEIRLLSGLIASDFEVDGIDTADYPDFCDAYIENARINARKEGTLLGRSPTQEGAKKTNGGDEFGEV